MTCTVEPIRWIGGLGPEDLSAATRIFNDAWAEWVPAERPMSESAYIDLDRFTAPPELIIRCLARDEHGQVVGHGHAYWREGPGGCTLRVFTDRARRREGIGRAVGRALADEARTSGRTSITLEVAEGSEAETIAKAAGFRPDFAVEQNRLDPRTIPDSLLEGWRAAGEAASGYSLVAYDIPCPTSELAEDFIHARHVMNDAPRWEGEPEATYTVEELHALEAASLAAHQDWWNVGVRHDATGELVGLSDMYLPSARPWMVFQGDTGVDPAHRGHGLGAWMKAVNHLRLRDERPAVEIVQTWNADANEPMLRINRALGFETVRRYRGWFRSFD